MVSFSCGEKDLFSNHVQGSTAIDTVHRVLQLHDRFGLGCIRVVDWTVVLQELRLAHVCTSPSSRGALWGDSTHCVVTDIICTLSSLCSLPSNRESLYVFRSIFVQANDWEGAAWK